MKLKLLIDSKLKKEFQDHQEALRELSKIAVFVNKTLSKEKEFVEALDVLSFTPRFLNLRLCSDEEMRAYQKEFRRLNRTTDVLSFPALEGPQWEQTEQSWGDLVISLETVLRHARAHRRSFQNELWEVFIHGFLHLVGFDHVKVSRSKSERMKKVQRRLFQQYKRDR